jgi:hypothetical protein
VNSEVIKNSDDVLCKESIREKIIDFENLLRQDENVFLGDSDICPLKHSFTDGVYVREIFIPAGTYLVGKIHKHEHPNFLLSGVVDIVTEEGTTTLIGPLSMISPAGTKRALHAKTDVVWVTIHSNPSNTDDLGKLEKEIIAEDYNSYSKFIKNKNKNIFSKIINKFLKGGIK